MIPLMRPLKHAYGASYPPRAGHYSTRAGTGTASKAGSMMMITKQPQRPTGRPNPGRFKLVPACQWNSKLQEMNRGRLILSCRCGAQTLRVSSGDHQDRNTGSSTHGESNAELVTRDSLYARPLGTTSHNLLDRIVVRADSGSTSFSMPNLASLCARSSAYPSTVLSIMVCSKANQQTGRQAGQ